MPESKAQGDTKYDIPGAVVVTLGLTSLVYGFTKAAVDGWDAPVTLGFIGAGVLLLAIVRGHRAAHAATRCCRCASSWTATAVART